MTTTETPTVPRKVGYLPPQFGLTTAYGTDRCDACRQTLNVLVICAEEDDVSLCGECLSIALELVSGIKFHRQYLTQSAQRELGRRVGAANKQRRQLAERT